MRALVVASHGSLSSGIVDSLEMIAGKSEAIYTLSLTEGINDFSESMESLISKLNESYKEILILCDLKGGTPYNESMRQLLTHQNRIKLVAGVNLPMLIEVSFQLQSFSLNKLEQLAIESGQKAISN